MNFFIFHQLTSADEDDKARTEALPGQVSGQLFCLMRGSYFNESKNP
jgi:hypothetical protein